MTTEEQAKIDATALAASQQKSLELLFDYTKFHIGLYLTLTASYIAATTLKGGNGGLVLEIDRRLFWPAVLLFMLAGLGGGIIASSITQTSSRSSRDFLNTQIGAWEVSWLKLKARYWTWIEHTAFWMGLILATISARPSPAVAASQSSGSNVSTQVPWLPMNIPPDIVKGLPAAFVALIIGVVAAVVAWNQYKVARTKLKLDLFDKRYEIFTQTWEILSDVVRSGTRTKSYGLGTPFNNFIPKAAFLFGKDVEEYLNVVSKNWTELYGLEAERADVQGADRVKSIARASDLRKWFFDQASNGAKDVFGAYLNFDGWR